MGSFYEGEMSEVDVARSEEIKAQANKLFVEKKWGEAEEAYSRAIELNPTNAILYANRSATQLNSEAYGAAITDAAKAIELDPTYVKGYYRRGCAYVSLGKFKEALADFRQVCKLAPRDKAAAGRLKECQKQYQRLQFEKAIEYEGTKPPSETIDVDSMDINNSYTGLHLPETIDLEFIQQLMEFFREQNKLHLKYVFQILLKVKEILAAQKSLVDIPVPQDGKVIVFGDVHGQYYDLLHALSLSGLPSENNILVFNGDLVDRGSWSVEVIVLLLCMKVAFPKFIHIARGNHEAKSMNKVYGFEGEVRAKYNETCFDLFLEIFCYLPLAHVIGEKVFVCHGGLFAEDGIKLEDIRKINRVREPPENGPMCDLLWSDPVEGANGRHPSKRGVGVGFGPDVTKNFLEQNNLELVVRSHEVRHEGYSLEHDNKLITIFSAPNYCDREGNKAAFITFKEDLKPQFTQFSAVEHPPMKPMAYSNSSMFGL